MRSHDFEWNDAKAATNLRLHGISFQRATEVFFDPIMVCVDDDEHSYEEDRMRAIGRTFESETLVVVSHTQRGGRIRIISARLADHAETRRYMNKKIERLRDAARPQYAAATSQTPIHPLGSRMVITIVLDDDVIPHFKGADAVNEALRGYIRRHGVAPLPSFADLDDDPPSDADSSDGAHGRCYLGPKTRDAIVTLDEDVSDHLDNGAAVNDALRTLIAEGRRS